MFDPELAIERAIEYYRRKGYTEDWISQPLFSIRARKNLTFEWRERGVKTNSEYAILTNDIYRAWSDMPAREYKTFKGLANESLRDNMTNLELVLNMLAEATTTEISKERKPRTAAANRAVAAQGGRIAGNTRREIEAQTGKKIVSRLNAEQVLEESYRRSRQNRHWPKKQPKGSNTRRQIRQNDPTVRNRFEAAICDLEFEITKWDIQLE